MKLIYPNRIYQVTASDEDSSFPATNLLDNYPKNVYKSTSKDGVLIVSLVNSGNSIAIFGTNAATITAAIMPLSTTTTNVITNGGFEDWTTGNPDDWSEEINVTTDQDTGQSGSYSVKLTATNTTLKQFYQTETVVAEKQYLAQFYYKNTAGDTLDYFVYDVTNAAYIIAETTLDDSTTWSYLKKITFKTPVGCVSIKIGFAPTNNGDIVWIDNVSLVEESESANYNLIIGDDRFNQIWIEYNYQIGTHDIVLTMESLITEILYAGITQGGVANSFNDPQKGLKEDFKDFSVINEFRFGSVYQNKRDIVRLFNGVLDLSTNGDFFTFMNSIVGQNGVVPIPFLITNLNNIQWTIFGRFITPPGGTHGYHSHSQINFNIEQVV